MPWKIEKFKNNKNFLKIWKWYYICEICELVSNIHPFTPLPGKATGLGSTLQSTGVQWTRFPFSSALQNIKWNFCFVKAFEYIFILLLDIS